MNKQVVVRPKKVLVRNVEVPLSKTNVKVKVGDARKCPRNYVVTEAGSDAGMSSDISVLKTPNNKYCKPELNTCLDLVKKMQDTKQMKIKPIETERDLTPRSKQVYRNEITKVLNLPVDKKIYHHLIPLNVNDSMVLQTKEKYKRRTYTTGMSHLEPHLEEYLTQINPIKLIFPMNEEFDVVSKITTRDDFDYLQNLYATFGPDSITEL